MDPGGEQIRIRRIRGSCIVVVGRFKVTTIHYAAPGQSGDDVELIRCGDEIILPVSSFAAQVDELENEFGDKCWFTSTFAEFCEATVRCRFTQTEFRPAVVDQCGSDYDRAKIAFAYDCLPGRLPF